MNGQKRTPDENNEFGSPDTILPTNKMLRPERLNVKSPEEPETTPEKKERNRSLVLESLPDFVRTKLDAMIAQGKPSKELAYALRLEFKGKNEELDELLDSSDGAYRNYIDKYQNDILKLAADTKALTTDLRSSLAETKVAIDVMISPKMSLENKQQALLLLFDRCETRLRLLEAKQGTRFLDPQYEQMIHTYIKDQEHIVETLLSYSEELKKDNVAEFYKEFKSYTYTLLTTFNQVYKELWGDEKFLDFHAELDQRMAGVLTRWLHDRNQQV